MVDSMLGRILDTHYESGVGNRINIIVASDHGFSTRKSQSSLPSILNTGGMLERVVIAGGEAIYLKNQHDASLGAIAELLQRAPSVGAIFSRGRNSKSMRGRIPGTLSFRSIQWDHPRAGDLLVSSNWTHASNEYGYRGAFSWGKNAGHGSTSPYDIHATLIAFGADFKKGVRLKTPTANFDIAPTICRLHGLTVPKEMDGRVIREALIGGPDQSTLKVKMRTRRVRFDQYRLELIESSVENGRYVDFTRVTRTDK